MTVMSRLAQKKILNRERMGLHYEYWVPSPRDSQSFFDKIKYKFLGIKTSALVSYLIDSAEDLSDDEIEEMEKMLQKARKKQK
jgi:predicted transcriptional regulator